MATGPLFWAMRQTPGNSVAKLILIGICDQVPDRGDGSVLIALNDLATFGACTIRTVRTCIERLRAADLLRARRTVVVDENGRTGWMQFFPLFEGNPLQRGLLGDIDWAEPAEIESRELRNFISQTARVKAPDAIHNAGKGARARHLASVDNSESRGSSGTRKEIPGACGQVGTRKTVPGTSPENPSGSSRNVVPGTYPEGFSGLSTTASPPCSSSSSHPSDQAPVWPDTEHDVGDLRTLRVTAELWVSGRTATGLRTPPGHRPPHRQEAAELTRRVTDALAAGWTTTGLRSYIWQGLALDKIVNWPAFVLDKLDASKLPEPVPETLPFVPPVCGQCEARTGDPLRWRVEFVDGREVPCPRCNPAPGQRGSSGASRGSSGPADWLAQALQGCSQPETPGSQGMRTRA